MKTRSLVCLLATLSLLLPASHLRAQGTAFTYQGRLDDGGGPASGIYDLRFAIYDSSGGAGIIAGPVTNSPVAVSNGLFTVTLDFGPGVFTGPPRWLEIGVRSNLSGVFNTLTPRQSLIATPYAITAGNLTGPLNATQLTGTIPDPRLSANVSLFGPSVESAEIADATVEPADLNLTSFGTTFWKTDGNAGTILDTHFVGTTDNQPLELRVNGQRGLRLEPTAGNAPNLVAGAPVNRVLPGVVGATIGGGGALAFTNEVQSDFGVIAGGGQNLIGTNSRWATISGGGGNAVSHNAQFSTVSGGTFNQIQNHSERATIAGGWSNSIHGNANNATIGGGQLHTIHSGAAAATIAGGSHNNIFTGAATASIGGGIGNTIQTNAQRATIGGGAFNMIHADAGESTVGGGGFISIETSARSATIRGGGANRIETNASYVTIGGGFRNVIEPSAFYATLGGGQSNRIQSSAQYGTIGGGADNVVLASDLYATIPGGRDNRAGSYAFAAGQRAKADHVGTFVWADWTAADFTSTAVNQFLVRASGGVGIGATNLTGALYIRDPQRPPAAGMNFADNGLGLGQYRTNDYKWIQSYGGPLALNPLQNNVGINKTNPATALDVHGTVTATGFSGPGSGLTLLNAATVTSGTLADARLSGNVALRNQNNTFSASQSVPPGSAAAPGLSFNSDSDTGLFSPSANTLALATGGAERVRVAASGNVGIGADNPAAPLHVHTPVNVDVSVRLTSGGSWPLVLNQSGSSVFSITNGGQGQLFIPANGNVGIGTNNPAQRLHVVGNILATGTVTGSSDRNVKENFAPVDPQAVLEKVASLDIQRWNYIGERIPHIGPVAQDFHDAFQVGQDDRHISMVDADGVALAAIQGLNQKLEATRAELQRRDAENAELQRAVRELKELVQAMNHKLTGGTK